jgi:hypothetical protein
VGGSSISSISVGDVRLFIGEPVTVTITLEVHMRVLRVLLLAILSAVVAATVAYFVAVRPKIRAWGLDPEESELPLPGDDLIVEPNATETRGLTIDAPVAKVWPWLVQMGFGRAGWYSYDVLDNKSKSAAGILPEFQSLKAGDIMPTHPGGGFEVKSVEFERALVLYTDTDLVRAQGEKAAEKAEAEGTPAESTPTGLKVSGTMIGASYPEFSASWAFYLRPTDEGKTRLIERFRAKTPGSGPANVVLGEVMGTGIVLMTRKQMLGIKERVERPMDAVEEITEQPTGGHEPQIDIPQLIGTDTPNEPSFAG